jgi:hypothetical protein
MKKPFLVSAALITLPFFGLLFVLFLKPRPEDTTEEHVYGGQNAS